MPHAHPDDWREPTEMETQTGQITHGLDLVWGSLREINDKINSLDRSESAESLKEIRSGLSAIFMALCVIIVIMLYCIEKK